MAASVTWFDQTNTDRLQELLGRAIVESADDAIIAKDLQGIIRSWNPGAERMFGYTAAEAVGHSIMLLIPTELHGEESMILERLSAGDRVDHYETIRVAKDGRRIPISLTISPIKDDDGHIIGASKIVRDISERRRAELTEVSLAAIVDFADDAILSKDINGVVKTWNKGAERLFGYTPDEMVGQPITKLFPPDRLDEEPVILDRIRRGERVEHFETERVTKDGRRIPISLTISPIRNHRGETIGISKIARDISDRKRAETALLEADRRKDEFLAMLAHELRNPLMPIKSALDIIHRNIGEPARRDWALQVIDRQLLQLTRIIDDLLELGRVAGGQLTLRKEPVTLRTLVAGAVETSKSVTTARRHVVRVQLPTQDVWLNVDPVRMVQAITNLLHNAAKFTESGSTISVSASCREQTLELCVKDSGRGIHPELLPKVFDMFVQGSRDLARTEGGLGIGLSIVRRIVELHGGSVSAASDGQNRGSEFRIRLPLAEYISPEAPAAAASDATGRWRLLVVDDNRDVTDTLAEFLQAGGHSVERHYHGDGVLEKALAFQADAVIMDLGLPGKDGYEVAQLIRRHPVLGALSIVALSGYGQPEDIERSRVAGIDSHLVKPVDHQRLLDAIADAIAVHRSS